MLEFNFPVDKLRDFLTLSDVYTGEVGNSYQIRKRITGYQVVYGGRVIKRSKYLTDLVLYIMWTTKNWHPTFRIGDPNGISYPIPTGNHEVCPED